MVSISRDLKDFILGEYTARRVGDELAYDDEHFTDPGAIDRIFNQFHDEILNRSGYAVNLPPDDDRIPVTANSNFLLRKNLLNEAIAQTLEELHKHYKTLFERHPDSMLYDLISDAPECFYNLPAALPGSNTLAALVKNNFTGAEIFGWLDPDLQRAFCLEGWSPDHTTQLSERYSLELSRRPDVTCQDIPGSHAYKLVLRRALTEACERLYTKHRVTLEKFPTQTVTAVLGAEKQQRTI